MGVAWQGFIYILPKIVMFFRGFLKESTRMMIFIPEKRYVMITLSLSTGADYSFCNFNWTTASSVMIHSDLHWLFDFSLQVLLTATSIDLFTKLNLILFSEEILVMRLKVSYFQNVLLLSSV